MGTINNDQAPFQIDMWIDNQMCSSSNTPINVVPFVGQLSMNNPFYACNESSSARCCLDIAFISHSLQSCGSGTCSCQDCPSVCVPLPPVVPSKSCAIAGLSCPVFFSVLFYVVFVFAAVVALFKFKKTLNHKESKHFIPAYIEKEPEYDYGWYMPRSEATHLAL